MPRATCLFGNARGALKKWNARMPPNYTYFTADEVAGLDPDLCAMLDMARGKAGFPFKITSGLRTADENKKAGGVVNSPHLKGLAADIACPDGFSRFKMVVAMLEAGFRRIEVSKDGHTHVDIAKDGYAQDWFGIE